MASYRELVHRQIREIAGARAATSPPLKAPTSAEELLSIPFTPGMRVLDVQTGMPATVRSATIAHRIVPATAAAAATAATPFFALPDRVDDVVITVELDGESTAERAPKDLIELPASLNVPLSHLEPGV